MAKLTTVEPENRGISANIIDCRIIECSIDSSFKKGRGACLRRNTVGNGRWGWLAKHGMQSGDGGWEQALSAIRLMHAAFPTMMMGTSLSVRPGLLRVIIYHVLH